MVSNGLVQGLVGAGIAAIVFAAGFAVGNARAPATEGDDPRELRVVLPAQIGIEHTGIKPDRAACLQWVSDHFESPNVGQFALMCAGEK